MGQTVISFHICKKVGHDLITAQFLDAMLASAPLMSHVFTPADISRIIEMAWEDRTPFEAIEHQFGLNESAVVWLMRREMKASSFKMWRKRMKSRVTKHAALRNF